MSKKQIYTVFTCDIWKGTDSMKLALCTTSVRKVKSFIASEIEKGNMEYNDGDEINAKQQVKKFRSEFDWRTRDVINDRLAYGFIDYCYDGEPI